MKNKYKFISIFLILFFLSLSFASASDIDNQTLNLENEDIISVDNANYKSFTELQTTLNNANDGDTIILNDSYINDIYTNVFTLNINKAITLDGNGNTLDGNQMARILNVNTDNVILKNLIFINGKDANSGAISWGANGGTIENCVFENNTASQYVGGAVTWNGNNGKIIGSTFKNNVAPSSGGAVRIQGDNFLISNNNFEKNTANNLGGAMIILGNSHNITDNTFTSNYATSSGGAVRIEGNNSRIMNNTFNKNTAKDNLGGAMISLGNYTYIGNNIFTDNIAGRDGGAIDLEGYVISETESIHGTHNTVINNTFENNRATYGGGISIYCKETDIIGNKFNENYASQLGGALRWAGATSDYGMIINNTFTNNSADVSGGAIFASLNNATLSGNTFITHVSTSKNGQNGGNGGTITIHGSDNQITDNGFVDSTATRNGGAIYSEGDNLAISNNKFTNTKAGNNGGAIYSIGNSASITGNEFENDKAIYGGAIYMPSPDSTISNNKFTNNTAEKSGGAIFSDQKITITDNEFNKNTVSTQGGAINSNGANSIIINNKFKENTANSGAAISSKGKETQITNNIFENNKGEGNGGAIRSEGDKTVINDNTFIDNTATGFGAGAYIQGSDVTVTDNIFTNNKAGSGTNGGALRWNGDNAKINDNTFRGNTANSGTAIWGNGANPEITGNKMLNSKTGDNSIRWTGDNQNIKDNIYEEFNPETKLVLNDVTITYGETSKLTATLTSNNTALAGKSVSIILNNKQTVANTNAQGQVSIDIKDLNAGTYPAIAKFEGDEYDASNATATVTINKASTEIVLTDVKDIIFGQELAMTASVNATGGSVTFDVDGNKTTLPLLSNGKAIYLFKPTLGDHTYNVTAIYNPSANYLSSSVSATFKTTRIITTLSGENVTIYKGMDGQLVFTLTGNKTTMGIREVTVNFNGENYTQRTDLNGKLTIDLANLAIGTYTATVSYAGNEIYAPSTATATATIKSTIESEDLVADYGNAKYSAKFVDATGKALASGTEVTFSIGNEQYPVKVNAGGVATLDINKSAGNYVITNINPSTGEVTKNNITINKVATKTTITGAKDIIPSENLTITVNTNATGELTIKINNNTTTTNYTGGDLNINLNDLPEGQYTITATYNDPAGNYLTSQATTNFKVEKITTEIEMKDVTINYGETATLTATLTQNNKALSGKTVTITLNDKTTQTTTDSKGQISINLKDLNADTYKATAKFEGDDTYKASDATATVTINKVATKTTITGAKDLFTGENSTIIVNVNASGELTIKLNDEVKTTNYTGGNFNINLNELSEGKYTLTVTYVDKNNNYLTSYADATFTVSKRENELTVKTNDIEEGQDAVFEVAATAQTGTVTLTIASKTYTENLTNGKATFTVSNLTADTYKYTVSVPGDKYYESNSTDGTIKVKSTTLIINASGLEKYFSNPERFTFTVTDKDGNPLENITIFITLNGRTYNRTTDANGSAGMNIGLPANNYTALLSFKGNDDYSPVNVTSSIVVKTTVYGSDLNKVEKAPGPYSATFLDPNGNKIASGVAEFNINGVLYYRDIVDGIGKLNLNLEAGKYVITAINPVTKEMTSNNITITSRFANNTDVTKYYRNDTQYYITLIGDDGKPVGAGETVTFNINGVMYERQTNENGTARLNINLNPGEYVITAMYKNCMVSNNIKVLPIIIAEDLVMKFQDGHKFEAKLVDGQGNPVSGVNLTFNINGVFYNRTTGSNGIAKLNINLMAGEYIITSYYGNFATSNKITIKP